MTGVEMPVFLHHSIYVQEGRVPALEIFVTTDDSRAE